jgi:type IV fimbrial biogenesis protein FimT
LHSADRQSGFTLIEIVISISLLVILAAVALPSISSFYSKAYVRNAAKALEEDLRLGSIEARTRIVQTNTGSPVILCPYNATQTACIATSPASPDAWHSGGWMLFVDRNGNNDYNFNQNQPNNPSESDTLINTTAGYAGKNYSLTFENTPTDNRIVFGLNGALNPGSFEPITIADTSNTYRQQISIDSDTGQTLRKQL